MKAGQAGPEHHSPHSHLSPCSPKVTLHNSLLSSSLPPEKLFQQSQVLLVVNPQLGCIKIQQTRVGVEPEKRIPKIWEIISSEAQAATTHCTHNNPTTGLFSEFRSFTAMELAVYTTHSHLHSDISKLNWKPNSTAITNHSFLTQKVIYHTSLLHVAVCAHFNGLQGF